MSAFRIIWRLYYSTAGCQLAWHWAVSLSLAEPMERRVQSQTCLSFVESRQRKTIGQGSFADLSRKCAWSGGPTGVTIGYPCRRRPKEHQRRTKGTPKEASAYFTIPFSKYSAKLVLTLAAAPSAATFAISLSTMIFTNSSKLVFDGFQPSIAFAFVGSPQRFTTSVGR